MDATNIAADIRNRGGASGVSGAMGPQGPQGPAGPQGIPGTPGSDGISAYEVAVANGFVGTEPEWLASLEGTPGVDGADGAPGIDGTNGTNGIDGTDGLSAYEIAVANGFVGTEAEWLTSLEGADGAPGIDGIDGTNGTNGIDGAPGIDGADGLSAYEVAVANGFVGTEAEWLASLEGTPGADGVDGAPGIDGTNGVDGIDGSNGVGVPIGGTAGQVLAKVDGSDYNTEWVNQTGGGGSGSGIATNVEIYVKNETGTTLTKGQVVYVNGSNGNNVTIALSKGDAESTSSKTVGLLKQDLTNGSHGYVVTEGILEGLNTDGLTAGDPMWLSPTTAGGVVYGLANKPSAPNHMVYLGVVERVQLINGSVYVKVQNGFELNELHNVALSSIENGQTISYDSTASLWKNTYATSTTIKVKIWNDTTLDGSITLTKGTVVYGTRPLADGSNDYLRVTRRGSNLYTPNQARIYGVVEEDIPFGGYGYMITYGFAYVNTSLPSAAYDVYLDINGLLTITKPIEPAYAIRIGGTATIDSIFVNVDYDILNLTDLYNVTATSPTNNQVLTYQTSSSRWVNATLPTIPTTLDSLTDVLATSPNMDDIIVYSGVSARWIATPNSLGRLTNVNIPSPTDGQVLTYDSATSEWVAAAGGGSNTRTTASVTSTSIADKAVYTGTIALSEAYRLYSITTDVPARVRLYDTSAHQTADVARLIGAPITSGTGVMLEYITTTDLLSSTLSPLVDGVSLDTVPSANIPITITNLSGSSGTVTVTFVYIAQEG